MTYGQDSAGVPLLLRPHHLLCLQNYRGRGYSEKFTDGMSRVACELRSHPQTPVLITEGADTLCRSCPNRRGEECSSLRPGLFDANVRNECRISSGSVMSWEEAKERTGPVTAEKITGLCPGCQWQSICLEISAGRAD